MTNQFTREVHNPWQRRTLVEVAMDHELAASHVLRPPERVRWDWTLKAWVEPGRLLMWRYDRSPRCSQRGRMAMGWCVQTLPRNVARGLRG